MTASSIAFADIDIRGISTDGYTLFKAAKEMHSGVQQIFPSELIDSDIIDDKLFKVIINAFAVRRAGASILKKR